MISSTIAWSSTAEHIPLHFSGSTKKHGDAPAPDPASTSKPAPTSTPAPAPAPSGSHACVCDLVNEGLAWVMRLYEEER